VTGAATPSGAAPGPPGPGPSGADPAAAQPSGADPAAATPPSGADPAAGPARTARPAAGRAGAAPGPFAGPRAGSADPGPGPGAAAAPGPLAGLRVLDLSRLLPGGYCTLLLADLGADVLKVEEPGKGDYLRWMPPYAATGDGAMHLALNRGKRSMTLNLKVSQGRDLLRELVREADVLVESFRPGVMDRLGAGWEVLSADNPQLIYVAISGYGADGPYADRAGHDINYLGYAGALSFSGHPDTGPWQPGLQVGDLGGGGLMAAVAILAALHARARTGTGQYCDVSMTDGVLSWLTLAAGAFAVTGTPPGVGTEVLNGGYACYGVYRCADGRHVTVGALEPQFFAALCRALGAEELVPWHLDPARQSDLHARLAGIFATRTRDDWLSVLVPADCCVGPVNDLAEAFADPQVAARAMVVPQALPDGTSFAQLGVVPRLAGTPGRVGGVASALGADTDDVLTALGYDADAVAALRSAGVV
jgi:crotonobetainyl-CoA:carnitine CoA-transferase CaiB-like acyl-CoA transferase